MSGGPVTVPPCRWARNGLRPHRDLTHGSGIALDGVPSGHRGSKSGELPRLSNTAHSHFREHDKDRVPADLSHFWVITVISNPQRYRRRYELYFKFARQCEAAGIRLVTVEQAFGDRQFMVTQPGNPQHVQVRGIDELWIKENMLNLAVRRVLELDPAASKIACIDADCFAMIPFREWIEETCHALDHYEIVQMWRDLLNFGPQNELIGDAQPGFIYFYEQHDFSIPKNWWDKRPSSSTQVTTQGTDYVSGSSAHMPGSRFRQDQFGRPGLAWAFNVPAGNRIGWFLDKCILGSGDWHMAHGFVGACTEQSTLVGVVRGHGSQEFALPNYSHYIFDFQEKCEHWIKRDVGYVPVTVGHWWHGKYRDRKYGSRGLILVENQYNPYTDVKYDAHGVLQLETVTPRQRRLRDQIRAYFRERNEDSIDV